MLVGFDAFPLETVIFWGTNSFIFGVCKWQGHGPGWSRMVVARCRTSILMLWTPQFTTCALPAQIQRISDLLNISYLGGVSSMLWNLELFIHELFWSFLERRILVRMQACRIFGREQHFAGFVVFRSLHQHCTTWMMLVDSIIIFSAHLHRSCCHLMDGQISIESNESFMVKIMFLKKWSQLSVKELRSATGEKMREVMYWYMKNPEAVGEDSLECYAILLMVQKSCTSWYNKYPIFYRGFYIPGGAGFWPSTVFFPFFFKSNFLLGNQEVIKLKVIQ